MATAILFLPAAATACPAGWTPSPASATCFFVPPERSTSLFRCVDLCEEYGGTPACIGSAEENNFVTAELAVADDLWLGLYQNETGSGPAKGWGRCVAGDAPSFTNWLEGQPDDYRTTIGLYDGYQQDCAWFDARTGQLRALACDASVYSYPFSCLCARGNASAAFSDDLVALKATRANNQQLVIERDRGRQRKRERLLTGGERGILRRRPRRRHTAHPTAPRPGGLAPAAPWCGRTESVRGQGAATSPSRSPTAAALSTPSGAASFAAVKGVLRAARDSDVGRRLHVSFAMVQAGWALSSISLTPSVMLWAGQWIETTVGTSFRWLMAMPLGLCLLLLALFPTDARAIRVACTIFFVLWMGMGVLILSATLAESKSTGNGEEVCQTEGFDPSECAVVGCCECAGPP